VRSSKQAALLRNEVVTGDGLGDARADGGYFNCEVVDAVL
jgi:hypothetical protein